MGPLNFFLDPSIFCPLGATLSSLDFNTGNEFLETPPFLCPKIEVNHGFQGVLCVPASGKNYRLSSSLATQHNSIFLGRSASGSIGPPLFHFYFFSGHPENTQNFHCSLMYFRWSPKIYPEIPPIPSFNILRNSFILPKLPSIPSSNNHLRILLELERPKKLSCLLKYDR
jgi:hypothetical protein